MADGAAPAQTLTQTSTVLVKNLLLGAQAATAALAALAARHEISVDEWLILDTLDSSDGAAMSEISQQTIASGASLTRAVDRLVSRSLVYRAPSATDRRKVQVHLSDLGRDLHARMRGAVSALDASLRSSFDVAGAEAMTTALGQLVADR